MSEFISKLQYKTYEKGEFSNERARSLEETIKLILDFPWDQQRGVDVQLTGPSVTIQDEYLNYLKVGLYFNGKFCLYYFTANHQLYEFHADALNEISRIVTDFFRKILDISKFEKQIFSLGAKTNFETAYFEYRVKKAKVILTIVGLTILLLFVIVGTIFVPRLPNAPSIIIVLYLLLDFLYMSAFIFYIRGFTKSKDMYLQISSGNDEFRFGLNEDIVETYNKKNVLCINIYGSSKNASGLKIIDLQFKDGSSIQFSGSLIDYFSLIGKFHGTEINYIRNTSKIWSMLWNFGK